MKNFTPKVCYTLLIALFLNGTSLFAQDTTTSFVNPIIIPLLIDVDEDNPLNLRMDAFFHNFNPYGTNPKSNKPVPTYAYNDANGSLIHNVLGPSIRWHYGDSVTLSVTNNLPVMSTTHWHGAHVPTNADGGPHQPIHQGQTWTNRIKILDQSATMWYHPHGMDITFEHVEKGLSGMLYVDDPSGDAIVTSLDSLLHSLHDSLPNTYAGNDFPLIFQTKKFIYDTTTNVATLQTQFNPTCADTTKKGYNSNYEYVVNAMVDPYLFVPKSLTRLRILNGDAKFAFNLGLGDRSFNPLGFYLIATDAGYTDKTYLMDEVTIAPGGRMEWLFDFSQFNHGDTLFIYNKVSDMEPGIIGNSTTTGGYAKDRVLLKIIVNDFFNIPPSPLVLPRDLRPLEEIDTSKVSKTRTKTFEMKSFMVDSCETGIMVSMLLPVIDGARMDMNVINDTILLDSTEIWTLNNKTTHAHPFHIHDIHFNVLELIDASGNVLHTRNNPGNYTHLFKGPLDNVMVPPGHQVKFIATFSDFGTDIDPKKTYMYHCHILPHEDLGMMGQFVVWDIENFPTKTEEIETFAPELTLYPNPTDGLLYMEGASSSNSTVRFFDIQGRLLKEQHLAPFDGTVQLAAQDLPNGMLLMQWVSEEGRVTKKIIKQ